MNGSIPPGDRGLQLILTLLLPGDTSTGITEFTHECSQYPRADQGKRKLGNGTWEDEVIGCTRCFVIPEAPSRLVTVGTTGRVSLVSSLWKHSTQES